MEEDKRIVAFCGHYGSGKTHCAINYALKRSMNREKVTICDLDIVNPYFRSRELFREIMDKGISIVSGALGHEASIEIPMLSADIAGPILDITSTCIIDLGGDDTGARVIRQFTSSLNCYEFDLFFVHNSYRVETSSLTKAREHVNKIGSAVGKQITGIVSNTHLLHETTESDIIFGLEKSIELSQATGICVKYCCLSKKLLNSDIRRILETNKIGVILTELEIRQNWMEY